MKKIFISSILIANAFFVFAQNRPYPQGITHPGCIKPSNVTQLQMNDGVYDYYTYWKGKYLKNDLTSLPGGYYVKGEITGGAGGYTPLGSSEGQGYGMIITALMAGKDANAQTIFDGLYKTARAFKSSENANLMGWVVADAVGAQGNFSSATDGDLDIAYALLLAHYQWGSAGTINYLQAAKDMITKGIKVSNVSSLNRINMGDWETKSSTNTRPSDWMLDHFHAFKDATNDVVWDNVLATTYSMLSTIQTTHSPNTGLLPDFCTGNPVAPAAPNFLESDNDGNYYYNACRTPLRIVLDYGHYSDTRAKDAVTKIVSFAKTTTGTVASKFKAGYTLAGANVLDNDYYDAVFVAPIVAGSVTDIQNQAFLNAGWTSITANKINYFSDTYNLLCQLFISGNWWAPKPKVTTGTGFIEDLNNEFKAVPNPSNDELALTFNSNNVGNVNIQIVNLLGEKVYQNLDYAQGDKIYISSLNAGIYFVQMSDMQDHINTQKIIIE